MSLRAFHGLVVLTLVLSACDEGDADPAAAGTTGGDATTDSPATTDEPVTTTISTTGQVSGPNATSAEGGEADSNTRGDEGSSSDEGASEGSSTGGEMGATSGGETGGTGEAVPEVPCVNVLGLLDEAEFTDFIASNAIRETFDYAGVLADTRRSASPWTSATDDEIWRPGDIADGLTIVAGDDGLQIVRSHLLGRGRPVSTAAGSAGVNIVTLRFSPPARGVAFTLSQADAGEVTIIANSPTEGLVGTADVMVGETTDFVGVCSPDPLHEVILMGRNDTTTVFDDVRFGSPGPGALGPG